MSRTARREKQKTIRALLGLGFATSACAAVAGTLVWAWSPQMGGWTLSPQQDFADASRDTGPRGGRTWVPPELPGVAPWSGENRDPDSAPGDVAQTDESTQIASVETKGSNSSGYGPLDFGQNDNNSGGGNFFGLFSSNGGNPSFGGGQGGSWNGTFNPNGGGRPGGFASYSGGAGGSGGGGGGDQSQTCEPGKIWNGSACVVPVMRILAPTCDDGKVWNGSACVAPQSPPAQETHECAANQHWNGTSCITTENDDSTGNEGEHSCGANERWNGSMCVVNTEDDTNNGSTSCGSNQLWNGTSCVAKEEDPPPPSGQCASGQHWDGTTCVADETDPQNGDGPGDNGPPKQNVELPVQDPVAVPEPGSLLMSLAALLGLGWSVRRRA